MEGIFHDTEGFICIFVVSMTNKEVNKVTRKHLSFAREVLSNV